MSAAPPSSTFSEKVYREMSQRREPLSARGLPGGLPRSRTLMRTRRLQKGFPE
jgi:hypothetical protein